MIRQHTTEGFFRYGGDVPFPMYNDFIDPYERAQLHDVASGTFKMAPTMLDVDELKWLAAQAGRIPTLNKLLPGIDWPLWVTLPEFGRGNAPFLKDDNRCEAWIPWDWIGQAMQCYWGVQNRRPSVRMEMKFENHGPHFFIEIVAHRSGQTRRVIQSKGATLSHALCSVLLAGFRDRDEVLDDTSYTTKGKISGKATMAAVKSAGSFTRFPILFAGWIKMCNGKFMCPDCLHQYGPDVTMAKTVCECCGRNARQVYLDKEKGGQRDGV